MKNIIIALSLFVAVYSCTKSDVGSINTSLEFSKGEFTDPRDNKTYGTVTINGQTWMTENLAYRLGRGAYDGCYTYYEPVAKVTDVKIDNLEFKAKAQEAVANGEIVEAPYGYGMRSIIGTIDKIQANSNLPFLLANLITTGDQTAYPEYYYDAYDVLMAIYAELSADGLYILAANNLYVMDSLTGGYSKNFGFLYDYDVIEEAIPDGWRLPTDEDWKNLELSLGMTTNSVQALDEWREIGENDIMDVLNDVYGFDIRYGGVKYYGKQGQNTPTMYSTFDFKDTHAYFWTATTVPGYEDDVDFVITRKFFVKYNGIHRGTSHPAAALSVRLIKE